MNKVKKNKQNTHKFTGVTGEVNEFFGIKFVFVN